MGYNPFSFLTYNNGVYYDCTSYGGLYGNGVLYSYDSTNTYTPLHSFGAITDNIDSIDSEQIDGFVSYSKPLILNNKIFGTTVAGGSNAVGTIYVYDLLNNKYNILYNFQSNLVTVNNVLQSDGVLPYGSLYNIANKLYGICQSGGSANAGILFEYDLTFQNYTILHNFFSNNVIGPIGLQADGIYPDAGVTTFNNRIYGTTTSVYNSQGVLFELLTQ